jgi:hypothetical protein
MPNRFYNKTFNALPLVTIPSAAHNGQYALVEAGFATLQAELDPYWLEIANARQSQASLADNLGRYIMALTGLTANLPANGFRITGLVAPTAGDEPATKGYADGLAFSPVLPAQAGSGGKFVTTSGSTASWANPNGVSSTVKTAGYTAAAGDQFMQNTTGGSFTLTLPPSPANGDAPILIADYAGTFNTNNLLIDPGSNKVEGSSGVFGMDLARFRGRLSFINSTQGWVFL